MLRSEVGIFVCIGALIVVLVYALVKGDKEKRLEIAGKCASYMEVAASRSDSLVARTACDQLWAAKEATDAANTAAGLAAYNAASRR